MVQSWENMMNHTCFIAIELKCIVGSIIYYVYPLVSYISKNCKIKSFKSLLVFIYYLANYWCDPDQRFQATGNLSNYINAHLTCHKLKVVCNVFVNHGVWIHYSSAFIRRTKLIFYGFNLSAWMMYMHTYIYVDFVFLTI